MANGRLCKFAGSATISPVSGLRFVPKSSGVVKNNPGNGVEVGITVTVGNGEAVGTISTSNVGSGVKVGAIVG